MNANEILSNIDYEKYIKAIDDTKIKIPQALTWSDVDPDRNPFDRNTVRDIVSHLVSTELAPPPALEYLDYQHSEYEARYREFLRDWSKLMDIRLVEAFGLWVIDWNWTTDEGSEIYSGGGPVKSCATLYSSFKSQKETTDTITNSILEWRDWLEKLSSIFSLYNLKANTLDKRQWSTLVSELITQTMEATEVCDAWYAHAKLVLNWALEDAGIDQERRAKIVQESLDGKYESWVAMTKEQIQQAADMIASAVAK